MTLSLSPPSFSPVDFFIFFLSLISYNSHHKSRVHGRETIPFFISHVNTTFRRHLHRTAQPDPVQRHRLSLSITLSLLPPLYLSPPSILTRGIFFFRRHLRRTAQPDPVQRDGAPLLHVLGHSGASHVRRRLRLRGQHRVPLHQGRGATHLDTIYR